MQKIRRRVPIFTTLLILLSANLCLAQVSSFNTYTNINKITVARPISDRVNIAFTELNSDINEDYSKLEFKPGVLNSTVPNKYVTKKLFVKFNIRNGTDSINSIYFFPGFYYPQIQLYRIEDSVLIKIPSILPSIPDSIGFRKISLNPNDSATILAEITFLKTYVNSIRPRLININHANTFIAELRSKHNRDNVLTYLFCGLLLMMIFYSIANFFHSAYREFLYYSGYAFFLGIMLFTKALYSFHINKTSFFLESYLDFILMTIGITFYMIFMKIFLNTKNKHPFLFRLYNIGIIFLITSILSYSYFHYFTNNFPVENLIETVTKFILLFFVSIFLVYSIRHWKDKILRYIFWGNLCLLLFSTISFIAVAVDSFSTSFPGIFGSSLFYYQLGLVLELVFFLSALNYKNNRRIIAQTKERENLRAQNRLKEYEKEIAVYKAQQEVRERISADMHDELGSGMTAIRLMSEIARNKMKGNTPIEIDRISSSADDVLNKMNAIIWSMDSGNDTLDSLISYIRAYSIDYFENTNVDCIVTVPDLIPAIEITGDKRRNIFLSLKETLNNVLKHANASQLSILIETNSILKIQVTDNGIGIDKENLRQFGNGIKNIAKRMESIGGSFTIENKNGTVTTLELPLI